MVVAVVEAVEVTVDEPFAIANRLLLITPIIWSNNQFLNGN